MRKGKKKNDGRYLQAGQEFEKMMQRPLKLSRKLSIFHC